nr:RPE-retinal G protein-coupled receptor isoform X2 [Dasypus novemcinctus]
MSGSPQQALATGRGQPRLHHLPSGGHKHVGASPCPSSGPAVPSGLLWRLNGGQDMRRRGDPEEFSCARSRPPTPTIPTARPPHRGPQDAHGGENLDGLGQPSLGGDPNPPAPRSKKLLQRKQQHVSFPSKVCRTWGQPLSPPLKTYHLGSLDPQTCPASLPPCASACTFLSFGNALPCLVLLANSLWRQAPSPFLTRAGRRRAADSEGGARPKGKGTSGQRGACLVCSVSKGRPIGGRWTNCAERVAGEEGAGRAIPRHPAPSARAASLQHLPCLAGLSGLVLNGLAIISFCKTPELRSPSRLLVLSLALADSGVSLNALVAATSSLLRRWPYGSGGCQAHGFQGFVTALASISSSAAIAWERCHRHCTRRRLAWSTAGCLVLCLWMAAAFWAALPLLGWGLYDYEPLGTCCTLDYSRGDRNFISFLVTLALFNFFLPLLIMLTSYRLMAQKLKRSGHVQSRSTGAGAGRAAGHEDGRPPVVSWPAFPAHGANSLTPRRPPQVSACWGGALACFQR